MKIRKLKICDSKLMLEWMHDSNVTSFLNKDFSSFTNNDCRKFIRNSWNNVHDIHMAIVTDSDEYIGTVSLKNIDRKNGDCELGIVVRTKGMGLGYSWFGVLESLKYAFLTLKLKSVYWCVSKLNVRACRFYEKHHFKEMKDVNIRLLNLYPQRNDLKWFIVNNDDDLLFQEKEILKCKLLSVKTIGTKGAGQLSFFESDRLIPFNIKRFYFITKVPAGVVRGFHAHKELKQFIFCVYGSVEIILDNGDTRDSVILDKPSIGLLITTPIWREMKWLKKDSVLCVAVSEYYDEEDYIRNYNDFLIFLKKAK